MRWVVVFLLLLAVQFVPDVGVGEARAECTLQSGSSDPSVPGATWIGCASASEAYAKAQTFVGSQQRWHQSCAGTYTGMRVDHVPEAKRFVAYMVGTGGCGGQYAHSTVYYVAINCPAGTTWDEATLSCFDPQACLAHNSEPGFMNVGVVTKPFYERCVGGCQYKALPGSGVVHIEGADYDLVTGEFEFTGQACAPELPAEDASNIQNPKPQECVTVPGGGDFPMCVKNNGEHCLTAPSTGRQFCWRPGEVGEKTGGPALQKREAGTASTPPTTPPPTNSSFVPDGGTVTTQTTVNSNVIVTTFTNYRTDSGVDAGPTDSSEPADGTGGDSSSGDDDPGSVQGGVDCDNPPVVQGGDPLLANVILQTWGTRCAVESANAVTSSGEIGDCKSVWTIDGPEGDVNVEKLKAARAEICGPDSNGDGISDHYQSDETPPTRDQGIASGDTNEDGTGGVTAGQAFGEGVSADTGDLDWSGWGLTRTCPTIPPITLLGGRVVVYDTAPLCDIMQTLGHILLLLSSLVALRIMGGGIP